MTGKHRLDIHHIFPKAWCELHQKSPDRYDSIINKTTISTRTNQMIGKKAPSKYIEFLLNNKENTRNEDEMREILNRHWYRLRLIKR